MRIRPAVLLEALLGFGDLRRVPEVAEAGLVAADEKDGDVIADRVGAVGVEDPQDRGALAYGVLCVGGVRRRACMSNRDVTTGWDSSRRSSSRSRPWTSSAVSNAITSPKISSSVSANSLSHRSNNGWYWTFTNALYHIMRSTA